MATGIDGFSLTRPLPDLAATGVLAAQIAAGLQAGTCVALRGELGAGKTTLARAILGALGVDESVPSPSFTLVQSYETQAGPVFHFDLYRIEEAEELDELGLEDALEQGIVLIEWPERAAGRLPADTLWVDLHGLESGRRVLLRGPEDWKAHFVREPGHV